MLAYDYVLDRLKEASTWRGIILLLGTVGVGISVEAVPALVLIGTGIAGIIEMLRKEGKKPKDKEVK